MPDRSLYRRAALASNLIEWLELARSVPVAVEQAELLGAVVLRGAAEAATSTANV